MGNSVRKPLGFILLGALVLRVAAAFVLQDRLDHDLKRRFLIEGDANGYWELGENLAAGKPYEIYIPPRRVLRMPGFPALVAVGVRASDAMGIPDRKYLAARLILALVGTGACGLVYVLGKVLFDERTGLAAAAVAACTPSFIAFSVILLSETLFAAGILASLILMARLVRTGFRAEDRRRGVLLSLAAGVAIAAACYARPTWLLVGPIFAAVYGLSARGKPAALLRSGLLLAALAASLAPWAIRNYAVTGHLIFTTLWVGPSLYDGLNPRATGDSQMEFFEQDRQNDPRVRSLSEYEIDQYYRAKARRYIAENPGRTLELAAIKAWRFWKPWPNADQFGALWQRLAIGVAFVPALLFAAAGWWIHRRQFWAWALTLGPILYFSAVHAVFVGSLRYRLPAEYPLYVLAAAGALSLYRWCRATTSKPVAAAP